MIESEETEFDVVIMGGALAGSATAILLLDKDPSLRILILERSEQLGRRVGEATVEVSTFFLQRCLGLTHHLHQEHLVKNGLRFWFANELTQEIPDCSEIGGRYLARVSAYLVDRAKLDEAALKRSVDLGAKLRRPAQVADIELNEGGTQIITLKDGKTLRARWVVDASGVAAILARKNDWYETNEDHPISACWARWRGCINWEDPMLAREYPEWNKRCFGLRGTATNHLMGDGWWAWWIPLRGDEISIGVVFDQRRVQWSKEGRQADRLKAFLMKHPVGAKLLSDAECVDGDVHFRSNPAWCSQRISGDGFALVGDAAGFLDPFYSPGLDWLAFTAFGAM
ncbi:MAG: NAD(P)/FAD-dependent oxidoreductase [Limisphaerales bacterium]